MDLRRPTLSDKETILEMVAEFEAQDSPMDGGFLKSDSDYEDWLVDLADAEMGLNLPEGFVPYLQLVAFDEVGRALGFLNLRLMLNDFLLNKGGHIGYSIRPSKRGQGLAKEQLKRGLAFAKSKNLKRVLLTCHEGNAASREVILANGGAFEDKRGETERYWIRLD